MRVGDLERLHAQGEVTIASNKIFLVFGKTRWRPTAYVIEDKGVARSSGGEIGEHFQRSVIYANYLEEYIPEPARFAAFRLEGRVLPPELPAFSENFARAAVCGGTVSYTALQLAYWLGLTEVYLLGVDFNYTLPDLRPSSEFVGFQTYTPGNVSNYFVDGYLKPGEVHIAPDLDSSLCAYRAAQRKVEGCSRFKIFNATRGGKLEVFPRVELDAILNAAPVPPRLDAMEMEMDGELPANPGESPRELVELTEAAVAADIGVLRRYSFLDRIEEAQILIGGMYGEAKPGTAEFLGRESRTLFLHPPVTARYTVPVGNAGLLSFAIAMHPAVWSNPDTGPCRFLTRVDNEVVSDMTIDVRGDPSACRWFWVNVSVKGTILGEHVVEFETIGVDGISFRWALWRMPMFLWIVDSPELHPEYKLAISEA